MSDNSSLPPPPPITDKEGTYKYRLEHSKDRIEHDNDYTYYYINKSESNMKWYKMFIIIIVIAFIVLIVLIIMGVIKIDALPWVLAISGVLSGYCIYWYRNYKEDRDRSIQDAKDKIDKELNDKEEKKKQEEKQKQQDKAEQEMQQQIQKKTDNEKEQKAIDNLKKIKEIILNEDPNYIIDAKRDNNKVYDIIDTDFNSYPNILDNKKKNLNTMLTYSFDGDYYSELNTAVQLDNEISQDIKEYITDKIVQMNSARYH